PYAASDTSSRHWVPAPDVEYSDLGGSLSPFTDTDFLSDHVPSAEVPEPPAGPDMGDSGQPRDVSTMSVHTDQRAPLIKKTNEDSTDYTSMLLPGERAEAPHSPVRDDLSTTASLEGQEGPAPVPFAPALSITSAASTNSQGGREKEDRLANITTRSAWG